MPPSDGNEKGVAWVQRHMERACVPEKWKFQQIRLFKVNRACQGPIIVNKARFVGRDQDNLFRANKLNQQYVTSVVMRL